MANTPQARKRIRQTERRTAVNRARKSRVRTFMKKVETALAAGDKDAARKALEAAAPEIQGSVRKRVMHKNTAARKIGRLTRRLKAL